MLLVNGLHSSLRAHTFVWLCDRVLPQQVPQVPQVPQLVLPFLLLLVRPPPRGGTALPVPAPLPTHSPPSASTSGRV